MLYRLPGDKTAMVLSSTGPCMLKYWSVRHYCLISATVTQLLWCNCFLIGFESFSTGENFMPSTVILFKSLGLWGRACCCYFCYMGMLSNSLLHIYLLPKDMGCLGQKSFLHGAAVNTATQNESECWVLMSKWDIFITHYPPPCRSRKHHRGSNQ